MYRATVGSAVCADCHTEATEVFENTPHAHATETLVQDLLPVWLMGVFMGMIVSFLLSLPDLAQPVLPWDTPPDTTHQELLYGYKMLSNNLQAASQMNLLLAFRKATLRFPLPELERLMKLIASQANQHQPIRSQ